jgi:hypothetical protein
MPMILRRVANALRAQNWTAIAIELVIVIVGVFIGTQVSNWNQQRLEKHETEVLLGQLQPELRNFIDFYESAKVYYDTTRAYARTAFEGWQRDPKVTDEQFVIAAYQASQIYGWGMNGNNWTLIFGGQQLRNIEDVETRKGLSVLMTTDYSYLDNKAVDTPYREHIRRAIPEDVQDAIRTTCGDRPPAGKPLLLLLPRTCAIEIPPERFRAVATALRARPQLAEDLRWHQSAVVTYLANMTPLESETRDLLTRIEARN